MDMKNDIDTDYFKEKLEEELFWLKKNSIILAEKNPDNKNDWEAGLL